MKIIESQSRTIVKAILYRIVSVLAIMMLTIAFGGDWTAAVKVGAVVIILGTAIYYVHERIWIRFIWGRSLQGTDSVYRSLSKTVIYRIITMTVSFIIAKIFIANSSNAAAAGFAIAQVVTNVCLFFATERLFNNIRWGITVQKELDDSTRE